MPCYDPRSDLDIDVEIKKAREEWDHNSPVSEMLCAVLSRLDVESVKKLSNEIKTWWREHLKRDKARGEVHEENSKFCFVDPVLSPLKPLLWEQLSENGKTFWRAKLNLHLFYLIDKINLGSEFSYFVGLYDQNHQAVWRAEAMGSTLNDAKADCWNHAHIFIGPALK